MSQNPYQAAREATTQAFSMAAKFALNPEDITLPESGRGDIAVPCFRLGKLTNRPSAEVASQAAADITAWLPRQPGQLIARVAAAGPYINIFLKRQLLADSIVREINQTGSAYGERERTGQRILLEYVSPNTNKPLHLGHLRNAVLGASVGQLLTHNGYEVIKTAIVNDRGIHIMKSMLAYQKWSKEWSDGKLIHETPTNMKMKGDAFVGKYYVLYADKLKDTPTLDDEARELLRHWEAGDKSVRALWKKMNGWALKGHLATAKRLGISFDKLYFESDIYEEGRQMILDKVGEGQAKKNDDGSVVINLTAEGLGEKVLLRADGTTVYITQDLALARNRLADYKPNLLLYVVGQEQDYQFRVLFAVLKRFGIVPPDIALKHLSYHWVYLPEGRMKSREGTVIEIDTLLDELVRLAITEIKQRNVEPHGTESRTVPTPARTCARIKVSRAEEKQRAEKIALAAVKHFFLKVRPGSDIHFDPKQSLSFTGNTGPYLLYTYARISSIFRRLNNSLKVAPSAPNVSNTPQTTDPEPHSIANTEWRVVWLLARYSLTIKQAAQALDPSLLTDFCYELAKALNDFYESSPVLKAEPILRARRLALLKAAQIVLVSCFDILGIEPLEEM